jgi:hypothetical protein
VLKPNSKAVHRAFAVQPYFSFQLSEFQLLPCHHAVAGGLGKGLAGKSATQRATKFVAGGFPPLAHQLKLA